MYSLDPFFPHLLFSVEVLSYWLDQLVQFAGQFFVRPETFVLTFAFPTHRRISNPSSTEFAKLIPQPQSSPSPCFLTFSSTLPPRRGVLPLSSFLRPVPIIPSSAATEAANLCSSLKTYLPGAGSQMPFFNSSSGTLKRCMDFALIRGASTPGFFFPPPPVSLFPSLAPLSLRFQALFDLPPFALIVPPESLYGFSLPFPPCDVPPPNPPSQLFDNSKSDVRTPVGDHYSPSVLKKNP